MKKKVLSLLLALTAALGVLATGVQAATIGPFFFMKAEAAAPVELKAGEQFTVDIRGGLLNPGDQKMISFQFTLDYPEHQVQLVKLEPVGAAKYVGAFTPNLKDGTATYNAMNSTGVVLSADPGETLARATFKVLPTATTGSFRVGLKNAEITRPQDSVSTLGEVVPTGLVRISTVPMLALPAEGSAAGTFVEPELKNNPAGTLITAVYSAEGQQLRCAVTPNVPENAGKLKVELSLEGGALVKAFLLDSSTYVPLCEEAQMLLK